MSSFDNNAQYNNGQNNTDELLNAYLDRELSAQDARDLEARLADEPELAQDLETLKRLSRQFHTDEEDYKVASRIKEAVRLASKKPRRSVWLWRVLPVVGAAAIVTVLVTTQLLPTGIDPNMMVTSEELYEQYNDAFSVFETTN